MKNIFKIIKISKPLWGLVAVLSVLILFGALLELVSPILSKYIVDEIVAKVQGQGGNVQRLIFLIAAAFLANLVGIINGSVSDRLGDHFAGKLRKFLTEKFYDKVLSLPQSYFDSEISGKIVNQLNRAIFTIQSFINGSTNFILPMILQSIFTITVLFIYSVPIAIFMTSLFPIYLIISYWSAKKWGQYEEQKNKIEDVTRGRIGEVVGNIKLVKSFINQDNEFRLISGNLSGVNKIFAKQSNMYHIYDFCRNFSLHIILLLVNLVVFYKTFQGEITIGTLVLILQLVNQARRPLFAMSFIFSNIQAAEAGSKEYLEILALESAENFKSKTGKKITNPTLEFKNVSFAYEKSESVLKNISFKIGDLETVSLVGPSGTGKTTVINLICKFYESYKGTIMLNGKSYKSLDHNFIRNNIALVFQESELFSTTVLENVAYGNVKHSEGEVINALKLANAWGFVKALPKGILSEVGERGIKLSGGQKQRIQIARAILKDSPILILDEATSSLDAKSEKEVQGALENLMHDKLVIIIAHRFSTIQNVDRIIVLEDGEIADIGKPNELSARPGIYRDLLNYQIEGNKKLLEKFELTR